MTREELTKLAGEPCLYAGHGDIGLRDVPECAASGMRPHGWCAPCVYRAATAQAEAERDDAQSNACTVSRTLDQFVARAEQAEAENAELRQLIVDAADKIKSCGASYAWQAMLDLEKRLRAAGAGTK